MDKIQSLEQLLIDREDGRETEALATLADVAANRLRLYAVYSGQLSMTWLIDNQLPPEAA